MKVAIVGYGRMGKEIEKQALNSCISISKVIDSSLINSKDFKNINFSPDEIVIEFSAPKSIVSNIKILSDKGVNIVCGTTGWLDEIEKVKKIVKDAKIGFLYASNFSIGVNLFWEVIKFSSNLLNSFVQYDVFASEIHHKDKKDSPSGTALTMGNILLNNFSRKNSLVSKTLDRNILPNEIHLSSTRGGNVIGDHIVNYDCPDDYIEIKHSSRSRSGYALGAIECAKWLKGKEGFFGIEDYMKSKMI